MSRRLHRDFNIFWLGQTTSELGNFVTVIAIPFAAVAVLHASVFQVGVLTALGFAGALLVGLPVGVVVERRRKRPLMIAMDAIRCVILISVPIAYAFDALTLGQLYVVAFTHSVCSIVFNVANDTHLPSLVDSSELVDANAKMQTTASGAAIAAPPLAGVIIQALSAPYALFADAASFVVSAFSLRSIRRPEPAPHGGADGARTFLQIREGLGFVFGDSILRLNVASTATINFFSAAFDAVVIVFLVRVVGLSAFAIGALFAFGAMGALVGAALATRASDAIGCGRLVWLSLLVTAPFGLLIPLTHGGRGLVFFAAGEFFTKAGVILYGIANGTFATIYTPPQLLARMNASRRVLAQTWLAIGALVGGALGSALGPREALWIATAGAAFAGIWPLFGPLRTWDGDPTPREAAPPAVADARQA